MCQRATVSQQLFSCLTFVDADYVTRTQPGREDDVYMCGSLEAWERGSGGNWVCLIL